MKKYFYAEGDQHYGPFTVDELKDKKVIKTTLVWYEGRPDWQEAQTVPELAEILTIIPPPLNKSHNSPPPITTKKESKNEEINVAIPKKKSPIGKIIFIGLVCILVTYLIIYRNEIFGSGGSDSSGYYNTESSGETYEEKVKSVQEIEEENPTNFLTTDGSYRENFFGGKIEINGEIVSSATSATYKDPVIRINFYSKSETLIGTEEFTLYEIIKPNSTKKFEKEVTNYSDVSSLGWEVVSAEVY
jgi:hypothetical protein